MDGRELEFWLREADRARALEELARMTSIRLAMWADGSDYADAISALQHQVDESEGVTAQKVEDNWNALREIGRR
jgi:hypothetical protein